jgi:predicted  nucleic acid-binding Zn-ribbon protein
MADEQGADYAGYLGDVNVKIRDIEEKQRILQDRTLLIGDNLIDLKEKTQEQILEIKKALEILKQKTERIVSFIETISEEFSKFAKKDDVEILMKQAKMFQPLLSRKSSTIK